MRATPALRMASKSACVPVTLVSQYFCGSSTDSPTRDFAAKCKTPSKESSSTSPAWVMSASMNGTPRGTAELCPVDRSSNTVTSWPTAHSWAATTEPIYPAPPVTKTFMSNLPQSRRNGLGQHVRYERVHARFGAGEILQFVFGATDRKQLHVEPGFFAMGRTRLRGGLLMPRGDVGQLGVIEPIEATQYIQIECGECVALYIGELIDRSYLALGH